MAAQTGSEKPYNLIWQKFVDLFYKDTDAVFT